jgi:dehydrogenase/reductase SDR family member 12
MTAARDTFTKAVDAAMEATVVPSFTNIGYLVRRRLDKWAPLPNDLSDRIIVLTGASSGLGAAAAEQLAARGAQLLLVGRDPGRLGAIEHRCTELGGHVRTFSVDLTSLEQARDFVATITAKYDRVDVLIHNAGALVHSYRSTVEGFEQTYAAQVLSQQVITAGLLPLLRNSSDPRVVVVSSGGMYTQRLDPPAMQMVEEEYDGVRAYALAKRAQVALNEQWAKRVPDVTFAAMHPGWADTPGVADSLPTFRRITGPFLRSPEQGADTVVWLAATEDSLPSGKFWLDRSPRHTTKIPGWDGDANDHEQLWDLVSEQAQISPVA